MGLVKIFSWIPGFLIQFCLSGPGKNLIARNLDFRGVEAPNVADELSHAPVCRGSGGHRGFVFHSDLFDAWVRRSLFDARSLRDQAPASLDERGDRVDGR